jgi:aminoglycoside phosphotransferase (APT) family kinase protein
VSEVASVSHTDLIHELRPSAQDVRVLEGGEINDVISVDQAEVFRFPKTESARHNLRFEATLLADVKGKTSLQIPAPIELTPDASHGVFSYVPGEVLDAHQIAAFTDEEKTSLGRALATFIREVNAATTPAHIIELRSGLDPAFSDNAYYYDSMIKQGEKIGTQLLPVYKKYYERLKSLTGGSLPAPNMVTHGDLHTGNLLFHGHTLTGIIDFGDCDAATIYNELRPLYRLDFDVVTAIINDLNGAFGPVDPESLRLYAVTHELSILMRPESQPPNESFRARLSKELLTKWVGDNWSEL